MSDESMDVAAAAKLFKAINRVENRSLGLLDIDSDSTPEKSLDFLLDTHFPGNIRLDEMPSGLNDKYIQVSDLESEYLSFITYEKVLWTISTFGAHKAGGPDGLKPFMLGQLPKPILEGMVTLFRGSIALGHVPGCWRVSKVIFIPKPGKDDYTKAKSFRPISLTSFIFKTFEKIVLGEINDRYLDENPLSSNQHAFRKGSSCDSAISDMVNGIESAIHRGHYALGVFLDISGAFDNLDPQAGIAGMRRKNIPDFIVDWYAHYLKNRSIEVDLKGVKGTRGLTRGTPQGGVLSPLIWNLAFDELLDLFVDGPVRIKGFADDAGLLVSGPVLESLPGVVQGAVDKAVEWGHCNGLTFGAEKTIAVIFTTRRKVAAPKNLRIDGVPVKYSSSVKYLGVELDSKLSFSKHILSKINKAKGLLFKIRGAIGQLWGPKPCIARWAYTGIVRPMLTYGCLVWSHQAPRHKTHFGRLQRLAAMSTAHILGSNPTKGLEVILNLPPVELFVEAVSVQAACRIRNRNQIIWDGIGKGKNRGHLFLAKANCKKYGLEEVIYDISPAVSHWNKTFLIDKDSFDAGLPCEVSGISCYTDGSFIDGMAGWGFVYKGRKGLQSKGCGNLGPLTSVFQAEVVAINRAAVKLLEISDISIVTFFVDSQAALLALDKKHSTSLVVRECISALNELGRRGQVILRWIRAHSGHEDNEIADSLAKEGATACSDPPPMLVPMAHFRQEVKDNLIRIWAERWDAECLGRQTKIWFPTPSPGLSRNLLKLSRYELGHAIQILSGHNYLKYHMFN
ncbi:MAG: hypothetical protein L3J79_09890, partial [Candidatus Marinimicrobia bacterium]|nr:hypothetical protein [Candidatus Neomarinimicrobiota bacterium]